MYSVAGCVLEVARSRPNAAVVRAAHVVQRVLGASATRPERQLPASYIPALPPATPLSRDHHPLPSSTSFITPSRRVFLYTCRAAELGNRQSAPYLVLALRKPPSPDIETKGVYQVRIVAVAIRVALTWNVDIKSAKGRDGTQNPPLEVLARLLPRAAARITPMAPTNGVANPLP